MARFPIARQWSARDFSALARRRNWTAESLAQKFKGIIKTPSTKFFYRVMSGEHFPKIVIPFRSVLTFCSKQRDLWAAIKQVAARYAPAGVATSFRAKKMGNARLRKKKSSAKLSGNEQFRVGQLSDFVKPKLGQNRRTGTLTSTGHRRASTGRLRKRGYQYGRGSERRRTEFPSLLGEALLGTIRQAVRKLRAANLQNGRLDGDRLLDAKDAAALLAVSPDWLYRRADRLAFHAETGPTSGKI